MKPENKKKLQTRLENALNDLYHNATPRYPQAQNDYEAEQFQAWFEDHARCAIDDIGENDRATLQKDTKAGKRYYFKTRFHGPVYLFTYHYAKEGTRGGLYQWGRCGRTLAPSCMIKQRGGSSFSVDESYGEEDRTETKTDLILRLEAFNQYVNLWNKSIPEEWEYIKSEDPELQNAIEEHDGKKAFRRNVTEWR